MQHDDDMDIRNFLSRWKAEEPSPFLATRIIANATSMPQKKPWPQAFVVALAQSFSDWHYGLAYKGAALALCLALGLFTAQEINSTAPLNQSDAGAAVVGDMWTEEL